MFKLAPAAQESSICLRCQYRLMAGRSPRKSRSRQLQNPSQIPQPRSRCFSSQSLRRGEFSSDTQADESNSTITYTSSEYGRLSRKPFGPAQKSPLGIDSLGEPAEVLVLNNARRAGNSLGVLYPDGPAKALPTSLGGTCEALLEGIDAERGLIDMGQACSNIDRLKETVLEGRDITETTLSVADYTELVSKLQGGFDKKHLAQYWRRSHSPTNNTEALDLREIYASSLIARSVWSPETTSLKSANVPPLSSDTDYKHRVTEAKKLAVADRGKQWLAENIIQRSWGLHREQEGKDVGEVFLRMKQTHLDLLLNHKNDPMKRLSQTYSTKIEVSKKQGLLRIESDLFTCEDVVRMFIHILKGIKSATMPVKTKKTSPVHAVKHTPLHDNAYLRSIEKLTNTLIEKASSTKATDNSKHQEYIIYYLGSETSDLEDAQRLLKANDSTELVEQHHLRIQYPLPSNVSVIPVDHGDNLPLPARNMQWGRLASPAVQRSVKERRAGSISDDKPVARLIDDRAVIKGVTDLVRPGKEDLRLKTPQRYWNPGFSSGTRALLGQIAFPLRQAQKAEPKLRQAANNKAHLQKSLEVFQKVFVSTIPGMTRVMDRSQFSKLIPTECLWIRMLPSTNIDLPEEVAAHLPPLEMRIDITRKEKTAKLGMARLTKSHYELDLLLPQKTTDLRFMHKRYLYQTREEFDPSLLAFIDASNLDIWGSERLKTPNTLRLSIPTEAIGHFTKNRLDPESNSLPVDYTFASLEHRSQVQLPFHSTHNLRYSTIEAGRTGGRREELAITYAKPPPSLGEIRKPDHRTTAGPSRRSTIKNNSSPVLLDADDATTTEDETDPTGKQGARALIEAAESMIILIEQAKPDAQVAGLLDGKAEKLDPAPWRRPTAMADIRDSLFHRQPFIRPSRLPAKEEGGGG